MQFTADLSGLRPDVRESVIRRCYHEDSAKLHLAMIEQAKMMQWARNAMAPGGGRSKLGRLSSLIHVGLTQYMGSIYGTETVHQDPEFQPWLQKRHEEFRLPDVREKISVGWTPSIEGEGRGRGTRTIPNA